MQSLVSFIIPVFNEADRIGFCLERILNQKDCSVEVICIDDNSDDASYEIVCQYAEQYTNVKAIHNTRNMGAGYCRNLGLKEARGKYIWFVDADDYIEEHVLGELVELSENNNLDVLYFDIKREEDNKEDNKEDKYNNLQIERTDVMEGKELYCKICSKGIMRASVWCLLYSKQYLINAGVRFREGLMAEDAYFGMKALVLAKRSLYIKKVCYVYYKNPDSVTTRTSNEDYFIGIFTAYYDMLQFWKTIKGNDLLKKYTADFIARYYKLSKKYFKAADISKIDLYMADKREIWDEYQLFISKEKEGICIGELDKEKIALINNYDEIIIYGAGRVARELIAIIDKLEKKVIAYAVSENQRNNPRSIYGIPVMEIDKLLEYRKSALVIIATVPEKYNDIYTGLLDRGFDNVLMMMD